ncbi:DNA-methyltransferase [Chitinimonas lacunae]|uniref:Methyltransferase n=1 Tax=Chitinimonas lacunae TaxID=1963018 RepID=A0ABV8MZ40_9NEIS
MKRFSIDGFDLYQADVFDFLAMLQQQGVQADAVICDPPYSSGGAFAATRAQLPSKKYITSGQEKTYPEFEGDSMDQRAWTNWCRTWMVEAKQIIKPGGYMMAFTDWRQLPAMTDAIQQAGFVWRGVISWDKTESARAPHKGYFKHQAEYVVWASNGPCPAATHDGPYPGVVRVPVKPKEKRHMTAKPVPLMEQLCRAVAPAGLIVDPFSGSGSTGIAAMRMGRHFIGGEKSAEYFDIARAWAQEELSAAGQAA